MKVTLVYILLLLLSAPCTTAITIASKAGQLHGLIVDTSLTVLTVEGELNAADFQYINSDLRQLETLDLSNAVITEYHGDALLTGRTFSPANTLPEYALMGSTVKTLTLPHSLKTLAEGSLATSAITDLTITGSVDSIGKYLCNGCKNLSQVTITADIITVPEMAFKQCTSLTAVTLPASVKYIADGAFSGCSELSEINFPAGMVSIGDDSFYHSGLTEIDLSHNTRLKKIGSRAFAASPLLHSVLLPEQTTTLGDALFFDCNNLNTLQFPTRATSLTPYMLKGTALEDVTGLMHNRLESVGQYALYGNQQLSLIVLPGSITSLGTRAMAQIPNLEQLDASALSSLPTLGDEVFSGTASKEVELIAADDLVPELEVTPQWQEFKITPLSQAGVEESLSPTPGELKLRRDGNNLQLLSSLPMYMVSMYSSDGKLLGRIAANGSTEATLYLSPNTRQLIILSIHFSNGSKTVVKTTT
ncbi:MAG: leucine-rich repeat domain-containing protein [Ruminococcus flavefaciens]|nr:leucine-rich repeat domain-containing protein [Ruminococcus flavefaciens]